MQQLDVAILAPQAEILADQNANAGAVDVVDVAQVDDNLAASFLRESIDRGPEDELAIVQDQLPPQLEDGHVSDASFVNRQQRRAPFGDRDLDYSRAPPARLHSVARADR